MIGQYFNGQVQVFASLNDLKIGVQELIEDQVVPLLDPSMKTGAEHSIKQSSDCTIWDTLRERIGHGPVLWPPRREAVLRVLAPRVEEGVVPLAISPVPETAILRSALISRWYYPQRLDGPGGPLAAKEAE